jgi:hypothetical protein
MSARRRRVRSIAVRVVASLLLGAVVNVVVCCALALRPRSDVTIFEHYPNHPGAQLSATYIRVAFGEIHISQAQGGLFTNWRDDTVVISEEEFRALIPAGSAFELDQPALHGPENSGPDAVVYYSEVSLGWPMLGMRYTTTRRANEEQRQFDALSLPEILAQPLEQREYRSQLPRHLIPVGFVVDTVFYAAILWLLFAAPGRVRRWRRVRRGLCAKCAYPIGASDVCTECGAHIYRKIKARGSMGLPPPATPAQNSDPLP